MQILTAGDIELTIDPEFQSLIPCVDSDQTEELAHSVDKYGKFLDPIRYWVHEKRNIIVDGHRRYKLWCGLPEDTPVPPPLVEEIMFPDREAAMEWMELYQLARRNLTPQAASEIRGRMYNRRKKQRGDVVSLNTQQPDQQTPISSGNGQKTQHSTPIGQNVRLKSDVKNTAVDVAKKTGVTERTVRRDAKFVDALDRIGSVNQKAKEDIRSEALKVPKADVIAISNLPDKEMAQALSRLRQGKDWKADEPDFDDGKINKQFEALIRGLDDRAKVYGAGMGYQVAVNSLKMAHEKWVAWRDK